MMSSLSLPVVSLRVLFVVIFLTSLTDVSAAAGSSTLVSYGWSTIAAVSIVVIVCSILIVFACSSLCPHKAEFKDFNNENAFPDAQPVGDFRMYPPTEIVPDQVPVQFEPLPDLATRLRQRRLQIGSNLSHLRPKICHVGRERRESEEDMDGLTQSESAHEHHVKLERLLLNNGNTNCSRGQFQYIKELGNGWFGKVLQAEGQAILPGHKKTAAVVQMLREMASVSEDYAFLQESAAYRDVEHVNVLKWIGCCVEVRPYLTIYELCIVGDLKSYLRNQRSNYEQIDKQGLLVNFACDIAAGLQAMHQSNYVHRDIAIRNCLVAADLTVKVGDYGLSEEYFKDDYFFDPSGAALPIRWLAPEVVNFNGTTVTLRQITKDSNLWSFGVALWELASFGAMPYCDLSNAQVLRHVIQERTVTLFRPEVPVSNIHQLYQLMELCWSTPSQRPSLRNLRIMLLHLHSNKDEPDAQDFDRKWNQMMPRSAVPGGNIHHQALVETIDDAEDSFYPDDILPSSLSPVNAMPPQSYGMLGFDDRNLITQQYGIPGPDALQLRLEMRPTPRRSSDGSDLPDIASSIYTTSAVSALNSLVNAGSLQPSATSSLQSGDGVLQMSFERRTVVDQSDVTSSGELSRTTVELTPVFHVHATDTVNPLNAAMLEKSIAVQLEENHMQHFKDGMRDGLHEVAVGNGECRVVEDQGNSELSIGICDDFSTGFIGVQSCSSNAVGKSEKLSCNGYKYLTEDKCQNSEGISSENIGEAAIVSGSISNSFTADTHGNLSHSPVGETQLKPTGKNQTDNWSLIQPAEYYNDGSSGVLPPDGNDNTSSRSFMQFNDLTSADNIDRQNGVDVLRMGAFPCYAADDSIDIIEH